MNPSIQENSVLSIALAAIQEKFTDFVVAGEPEPLSGGLLNYVWRVKGRLPSNPESVIIKWAPAYIASSPEVWLDPARLIIEARAMSTLGPGGLLESTLPADMRLPRLYQLIESHNLILMEDLGHWPDLGRWLGESHPQVEAEAIGLSIGNFIGTLHKVTAHRPELAQSFDNKNIQRTRLEFQYENIQAYAQRAGLPDAADLGKRAVQFGQHLQQPGLCLIMGDLWPASVTVTAAGLRVIDWELAHYGRPAQDVGHLTAHLWMYVQRSPNPQIAANSRIMLQSFLSAYRGALGAEFVGIFGLDGVSESAIHFGSEILTRTVGAFQDGYLYGGLAHDHPAIREAVQTAAAHIRSPLENNTFDQLDWRLEDTTQR